jgi:hypothetical protein
MPVFMKEASQAILLLGVAQTQQLKQKADVPGFWDSCPYERMRVRRAHNKPVLLLRNGCVLKHRIPKSGCVPGYYAAA